MWDYRFGESRLSNLCLTLCMKSGQVGDVMKQLSEELIKLIKPTDRILKLIWVGQFSSLGIYIFIAFKSASLGTPTANAEIVYVFSAVAIAFMLVSIFVRRSLLSASAVVRHINGDVPSWYFRIFKTPVLSKRAVAVSNDLSETEQKLVGYASTMFKLQMIIWGLLNSTAIFGMMLSIMMAKEEIVLFFVIPVTVVLLTQFPSIRGLFEAGLIEKQFGRKR